TSLSSRYGRAIVEMEMPRRGSMVVPVVPVTPVVVPLVPVVAPVAEADERFGLVALRLRFGELLAQLVDALRQRRLCGDGRGPGGRRVQRRRGDDQAANRRLQEFEQTPLGPRPGLVLVVRHDSSPASDVGFGFQGNARRRTWSGRLGELE